MRLLLFANQYFSEKGVNHDLRFSTEILKRYGDLDIYIIHLGEESIDNVYSIQGMTMLNKMLAIKKYIQENKIDIVHIWGIGLMSYDHFVFYWGVILSGIKFVITPFNHVTKFSLNNKLFYEDPDVKTIVGNKRGSNKLRNQILAVFSPIAKKVYLLTFGKLFIRESKSIIFFSEFEKSEFISYCNYPKQTFILPEPILHIEKLISEKKNVSRTASFFNDERYSSCINIVYWGRLDYKVKGLDRIVGALISMRKKDPKKIIKIHLMGPDYNNGRIRIEKDIKEFSLEKYIIVHDEEAWRGTKKPLIDSDLSILASRADGFPRALRESIALQVPVIVSIETNFHDLIKKFNCGYAFNSQSELVDIFLKLNKKAINGLKGNCILASQFISEKEVALNLQRTYAIIENS